MGFILSSFESLVSSALEEESDPNQVRIVNYEEVLFRGKRLSESG